MIIHRPKKAAREADEKIYGSWRFILWPRHIGDYLVCLQWVRLQVHDNGNNTERVIWRRPDNVVFYDATETVSDF